MLTSDRSLAILGGRPSFAETLHVGRPHVRNREAFLQRAAAMLDTRWLTNNGPYVLELEERIAARVGVNHCIVVSNGTIALSLLARAAKLTGEVIVPSFTFVATAHALEWLGIVPVFCDIDADTWTLELDPPSLTRRLGIAAGLTPSLAKLRSIHAEGPIR